MWLVSKWIDTAVGKRIDECDDLSDKLDRLDERVTAISKKVGYVSHTNAARGPIGMRLSELEAAVRSEAERVANAHAERRAIKEEEANV